MSYEEQKYYIVKHFYIVLCYTNIKYIMIIISQAAALF